MRSLGEECFHFFWAVSRVNNSVDWTHRVWIMVLHIVVLRCGAQNDIIASKRSSEHFTYRHQSILYIGTIHY